ncbi:MAG: sensor signal transduction histidine kinase, partial [Bacillota bacterium]|nr:sensor signal transduction histidine kinase [Bacillota bacterium]
MYLDIKRKVSMPLVHLKSNVVIKINNELEKLIGYSKEELLGKSLNYINKILKINKQVCLENIVSCCEVFIFTKENEPLEVLIHKNTLSENELIYFIKEKTNSRINDRFQYVGAMLSYNKTGTAILSFPDLILLKSNQQLFDSIIPPSIQINNSLGINFKEILPMEYKKNIFEQIIMQVVENNEPYFFESMKFLNINNETKYFDVSFVPIFVSEKIKYIVHTLRDVTEKVVSSIIIKEQKDELEAIIENISDGLCTVDKDFNITKLNKKINEVVYYPDSINKTGDSLKYTKYYDFDGNPYEFGDFIEGKILKGEKIKDHKFIAHRPDGIFYFSESGSPIYDKDGNIKKALISIRNITDQVKKDQIIKAQKYQLEAIIENMNDEIIIFNKYGKIINMNKKAREMHLIKDNTNIDIEEIYKYTEFYEMDGSVISFDSLTKLKLINGEKTENKRIIRKINNNIQYMESTGTPIYYFQNNFICGVLVIRDISEIIKYEESLYNKAQYDSLSNIIENLDLGFFRYKFPELDIIDINKKGYFLIKQIIPNIGSHSSLIGKNINNIIFNHTIIDLINNASKNNMKSYNETVKYNINNKEISQKYIFHPVMDMNNEIIEVILIGIDITEEIKAKTELENSLKIQDEVYANVAHELKTPLNVIFSANQIMELFLKNDLTE